MTSSESRLSFEARPYVGARNSPWNQRPVFSDFIGSTSATSFWCTCSHTEHSNVHRSKPGTPKLMRVSIKSDRHFTRIWNSGHDARLGSGGSATLSVTGRGRDGAVIGPL
jgi:hypothetical protein